MVATDAAVAGWEHFETNDALLKRYGSFVIYPAYADQGDSNILTDKYNIYLPMFSDLKYTRSESSLLRLLSFF